MIKKIFFLSVLITSVFLSQPLPVLGEDPVCNSDSDCQQKIEQYVSKLNELGNAKNTLANQIKKIDSQISLTTLQIKQTEVSIKTLEKEIVDLSGKIDQLNVYLNQLSAAYIGQVNQNYRLSKWVPPFAYLITSSFNEYWNQQKYIAAIQKNSQENLLAMETSRTTFDMQKTEKAKKQDEMEKLKKTLASQQSSLNNQKKSKNVLLETTKNDEKTYQNLLAQAQAQLNSLRNFSGSAGGSACLSSSPGKGNDGFFFSQRDPSWCNQPINPYSLCGGQVCNNEPDDDVGHIGCAITSYAIIMKKKGSNDITPLSVALDKGNFCDNNGNCYSYAQKLLINRLQGNYKKYSASTVDSELKAGHYVMAELSAFSGTHFVVIIGGSNGNYKIHDPWFGPDQNLNDHYSTRSIISIRLFP